MTWDCSPFLSAMTRRQVCYQLDMPVTAGAPPWFVSHWECMLFLLSSSIRCKRPLGGSHQGTNAGMAPHQNALLLAG